MLPELALLWQNFLHFPHIFFSTALCIFSACDLLFPLFPFCFPFLSLSLSACAAGSHFAQSALKFIMLHNHLSSFPFHFLFPFGARSERIKIFRNIFHAFSRMATGNGKRSIAHGGGRICQLGEGERERERKREKKRDRER